MHLTISNFYEIRKYVAAGIAIFILPILIWLSYADNFDRNSLIILEELDHIVPKKLSYLINTTNCKIPDLDPLNYEILPFIRREEYQPCSKKPLLTYIERSEGIVKLKVNQSVIALYSSFRIKCCYSHILRHDGDFKVRHSKCKHFHKEVRIFHPHIRVICRNIFGGVYQNVHTAVIPQEFENKLSTKHHNSTNKIKIFMLGIDSVSNLNLQRTMPKVYSHLEQTFIGFKGYNKIEDNTFPNLMALLAGRSMDTLEPDCVRDATFDNCDIIWKSFKERGFITVYGEDEPFLNTFNYFKKGFSDPPTNVYLRPYFISAYLLPMIYKTKMGICSGPENTAERMLNAAKDFLSAFKNNPIFTLYWINSFSHDNVNLPTSMDDKFLTFLTDPVIADAMSDSIFVIFSDHGFRFGDIRFTYSGWLEERLPFLYFKFPETFQQSYPDFVNNFIINSQSRLTTPYDIYMTLQHLLQLSDNSYVIKPSLGCPKCKSLFDKPVEKNRTCEEASIPQHWCTCEGYTRISSSNSEVIQVGEYVIDQVNQLINGFSEEGYKCAKYVLSTVETVSRSNFVITDDTGGNRYLLLVKAYPYAMFEATVRKSGEHFELLGQISRLNKYGAYSSCIHHDVLKKYCFCDSWSTTILSHICYLFKCSVF